MKSNYKEQEKKFYKSYQNLCGMSKESVVLSFPKRLKRASGMFEKDGKKWKAKSPQDMDLYITQLGRDHLIEVSEVMINSASAAEDYTVTSPTGESVTLPSVTVDASWKYKSDTGMDINSIQVHAIFRVVNNNGRMEIASITEG